MTQLPPNSDPKDAKKTDGNQLFPVFLKLNELHTVLAGAGNVGLEKLNAILNNSQQARVTVIADSFLEEFYTIHSAYYPNISLIEKSFTESDLDNADLVIAATNNSELNNLISQAAHQRKLLINVADKPELCDFYLGSIVKKGDLKIGISTNGKSPTIAKRLKEVLAEGLPDELNISLQQMNTLRNSLSGDFTDKVKKLNEITSMLTEPGQPEDEKNFKWLLWYAIFVSLAFAGILLWFIIKK